jgi:predicted chitinase
MENLKNIEEFLNEQVNSGAAYGFFQNLLGIGNKDAEVGESPIDGTISEIPISGDKGKNVQAIMDAMKRHNITNPYTQRAILGCIGKESGFIPMNEIGYSGTSNDRIRKIFGKRITVSDSELESVKKDNVKFFDMVYGANATKALGFNTGNTSPGDGYKYRGRGFNQITFKSAYQRYQDILKSQGKLNKNIDILNNPDQLNDVDIAAEAAVLFFINGANNSTMQSKYGTKDINAFKDQDTALKGIVNINAGLGNNISSSLAGLQKATSIANQFKIDTQDNIA